MSMAKKGKQWENVDLYGTKQIYIVRKVSVKAIQNLTFIEFEPLCQTLWAFMSSFTMITH